MCLFSLRLVLEHVLRWEGKRCLLLHLDVGRHIVHGRIVMMHLGRFKGHGIMLMVEMLRWECLRVLEAEWMWVMLLRLLLLLLMLRLESGMRWHGMAVKGVHRCCRSLHRTQRTL